VIQRIQSIYLFAAIVFLTLMLFISLNTHEYPGMLSSWPLIMFLSLIIFLLFVILLLFKNRKLQIRLCYVSMIVLMFIEGLIFYYFNLETHVKEKSISYFPAIFPVVDIILIFLAVKAIKKDEELVKSMNRIR